MLLVAMPPLGCAGADESPGGSSSTSSSQPVVFDAPTWVGFDDGAGVLAVTVNGGDSAAWLLGAFDGRLDYRGEACRDSDDVCHTLGQTGGQLQFIGPCTVAVDGSTCIANLYWRQSQMSFVLRVPAGEQCWAWGNDAAYYNDLGCTRTDWDTSSYY